MKIGRTDFDDSIKQWSWLKFEKHFSKGGAAANELAVKNISLKKAYTMLTGKPAITRTAKNKKDVSKNKKPDSED